MSIQAPLKIVGEWGILTVEGKSKASLYGRNRPCWTS